MAVFDEMTEFAKSYIRYVWWRTEEPLDPRNAVMELVDAFHFILGYEIAINDGDTEEVARLIDYAYQKSEDLDPSEVNGLFKKFLSEFLADTLNVNYLIPFFNICRIVGLDWSGLYTYYIAKATLNNFRQENGYAEKPRTYIKMWFDGKNEDNYYLMRYVEDQLAEGKRPDSLDIKAWLHSMYAQVKVQASK
jgi:dimeric dUTPase (all-alpha-NTP-PPase superfamily)